MSHENRLLQKEQNESHRTDARGTSESIPGINTKKINEPMWIIFTDKVSEINFQINTG